MHGDKLIFNAELFYDLVNVDQLIGKTIARIDSQDGSYLMTFTDGESVRFRGAHGYEVYLNPDKIPEVSHG